MRKCASDPTNPITQSDPTYTATTVANLQRIRAELRQISAVRFLNVIDETAAGLTPVSAVLSIPLKQASARTSSCAEGLAPAHRFHFPRGRPDAFNPDTSASRRRETQGQAACGGCQLPRDERRRSEIPRPQCRCPAAQVRHLALALGQAPGLVVGHFGREASKRAQVAESVGQLDREDHAAAALRWAVGDWWCRQRSGQCSARRRSSLRWSLVEGLD